MAENSNSSESANASKLKLVATRRALDFQPDPTRKSTDAYPSTNYFKSVQWSADGTSVVTNSADNRIRTFILPPELLDERPEPIQLEPYSEIVSHEPVDAVLVYPDFNLQDVSTTLVLSAINDHPIRLHSALTSDLVATYPLIHPATETYIKPHCVSFVNHGSQFVAGSKNLISTFDVSRPGQEPVSSLVTGSRSKKKLLNDRDECMQGIVSALAPDVEQNVLAAGTLTRHVALYDTARSEECLGIFTVQDTKADQHVGGTGITQLLWSPCNRYLYIAERKSRGTLMYDIRQTGQLLGWLEGREAVTNQRLNIEVGVPNVVSETAFGHHIFAGGTDGLVKVWHNPHHQENAIVPTSQHWIQNDTISGIGLHRSGSVLATVSGHRRYAKPGARINEEPISPRDAYLNIWSIEDGSL